MVEVKIELDMSLEKNAGIYFDRSKKAKKKLEGAHIALENSLKKLRRIEAKQDKQVKKEYNEPTVTEWYEKFRWFIASNGMLVIGGRDATTNEIIIKKHAEKGDLVFHTDMSGSPFFVLKTKGERVSEDVLVEVGDATCSFSKAWKLGLGSQKVFYVEPEQVTKTPNTGEYLTKGAFVIRGKTNYVDNKINLAVGMLDDNRLMCGPKESVTKICKESYVIEQGDEKTSGIAKKLKAKFNFKDLDYIIRILPTGGIKFKEVRKRK